VNAAADLTFLTDPPANRLEALKGDQKAATAFA
jgi:plasmid maintenance system killer protein